MVIRSSESCEEAIAASSSTDVTLQPLVQCAPHRAIMSLRGFLFLLPLLLGCLCLAQPQKEGVDDHVDDGDSGEEEEGDNSHQRLGRLREVRDEARSPRARSPSPYPEWEDPGSHHSTAGSSNDCFSSSSFPGMPQLQWGPAGVPMGSEAQGIMHACSNACSNADPAYPQGEQMGSFGCGGAHVVMPSTTHGSTTSCNAAGGPLRRYVTIGFANGVPGMCWVAALNSPPPSDHESRKVWGDANLAL